VKADGGLLFFKSEVISKDYNSSQLPTLLGVVSTLRAKTLAMVKRALLIGIALFLKA
jgi:hypothetical protein